MVQQAVKVSSSQGNIFSLQQLASSFQNLLTQQNVPTGVPQKNLNCLFNGTERYKVFQRKRFGKKSKKLSEAIHNVMLPPLTNKFSITDIICEKTKQKKNCPKEIAASQRNIYTTKEKTRQIRRYPELRRDGKQPTLWW